MKKKILYLFSDTGGGHRSAALALIRAAEKLKKDGVHQEMIDVFAACSGFLNIFAKMYAPVIKYSPKLWGQLYYWLDDERKLEQLERLSRPFILRELKKLILEKRPDVIVSVHPLVNHLTVKAIRETGISLPFIVVITDPVTLHRAWIAPQVDRCIVATPAAKKNAVRYGMPERKIRVIGMPIDPKFIDKAEARAKAGNKARGLFTILLMGGGEGAGGMAEIIEEFERTGFDGQLIIIAGRNKQLEKKLKARKFSFKTKIFGFTDKVPELMGESDLVITKAGPGTIAEAMAMGLPIIITSWLPGQEEGNVEFVVRENVGRVSKDPRRVVELVREIRETNEFREMKENIKKVSRPQAALDIAREIFRYI
jgi:1,2-diacylglycerol 3-beta-galactosyltransferase